MPTDSKNYFLIFDTNVLYQTYEKKADFTSFTFNATFDNIVSAINQLDIYEKVTIAIPNVVWNEMTKQIIDAHKNKLKDFEQYIKKWKFPEYLIKGPFSGDYSTYIQEKIDGYKEEISSGINNVIVLPLPSDERFKRIVRRAYDKEPPFGGKDKNSDKGFKDVLIWESILEFVASNSLSDVIFYTKDNGFKDKLMLEFKSLYPKANIIICSTEDEVKLQLETWAKEIDIYSYQPIIEYEEHQEFIDWLESGDFAIQLIEHDFGLTEKSRIITSTSISLIDYDNIQLSNNSGDSKKYLFDATLKAVYSFNEKMSITENINVRVEVECFDDTDYSIKSIYKTDDGSEELISESEG